MKLHGDIYRDELTLKLNRTELEHFFDELLAHMKNPDLEEYEIVLVSHKDKRLKFDAKTRVNQSNLK